MVTESDVLLHRLQINSNLYPKRVRISYLASFLLFYTEAAHVSVSNLVVFLFLIEITHTIKLAKMITTTTKNENPQSAKEMEKGTYPSGKSKLVTLGGQFGAIT